MEQWDWEALWDDDELDWDEEEMPEPDEVAVTALGPDPHLVESTFSIACAKGHRWLVFHDRLQSHGGVAFSIAEVTCPRCGEVAPEYQGIADRLEIENLKRLLKAARREAPNGVEIKKAH